MTFIGLIDIVSHNSNYQRFVITPDGTAYALIVTDIDAVKKFNMNYPRQRPVKGFEVRFPDNIIDEIREAEFLAKGQKDIALVLILGKYNSGIALLKQNADGNFTRVNAKESKGQLGEKIYIADNCK